MKLSYWIKEKLETKQYRLSEHVLRAMTGGRLTLDHILMVLSTGKIIETHTNPKRDKCHVVLGHVDTKPIHVMIAGEKHSVLDILIAYEPKGFLWQTPEKRSDIKRAAMGTEYHECFFCTGMVESITMGNFDYRLEGELYIVRDVPAGLCQQCGEKYVYPDVAQKINDMIKKEQYIGEDTVRVMRYTE
jgi:YgiT-type zinc finger domain-containing protein